MKSNFVVEWMNGQPDLPPMEKVDKLKMDTDENLEKSLLELHKISEDQYRGGGVG